MSALCIEMGNYNWQHGCFKIVTIFDLINQRLLQQPGTKKIVQWYVIIEGKSCEFIFHVNKSRSIFKFSNKLLSQEMSSEIRILRSRKSFLSIIHWLIEVKASLCCLTEWYWKCKYAMPLSVQHLASFILSFLHFHQQIYILWMDHCCMDLPSFGWYFFVLFVGVRIFQYLKKKNVERTRVLQ